MWFLITTVAKCGSEASCRDILILGECVFNQITPISPKPGKGDDVMSEYLYLLCRMLGVLCKSGKRDMFRFSALHCIGPRPHTKLLFYLFCVNWHTTNSPSMLESQI